LKTEESEIFCSKSPCFINKNKKAAASPYAENRRVKIVISFNLNDIVLKECKKLDFLLTSKN
jgi:hypothetical protein